MYQSPPCRPSSTPSSAPAATAASAVVTRSTPSAPRPRRRSHSAATTSGARESFASTSSSKTKSFCVPWPFAKITCSGYVPQGPQHGVDEPTTSCAVQPLDTVVAPEPRPLPSHIAPGGDERQLACSQQRWLPIGGLERGDRLRVTQRPRCRHTVTQARLQELGHLVDEPAIEHSLGARRQ